MTAVPRPVPTAETRPFWDGLVQGELRLPWCERCGRFLHPGAAICRDCLGAVRWAAVSPRVALHSFTIVHRPFVAGLQAPYGVAAVVPEVAPAVVLDTSLAVADAAGLAPGRSGELVCVGRPPEPVLHRFAPDLHDERPGHR